MHILKIILLVLKMLNVILDICLCSSVVSFMAKIYVLL